ncbi:MAG: translation initiation factor IF-2 [Patescibacteria group bacterium]|nr:translation initiation factor IF-2 [Patescibacteria group bacterium]
MVKPRPPIVTILGHVDHGKTSLLDYIRKSRLTAKEHGGITQRIGAYEIATGIKGYATDKLTFIDTPGHEAFSKLRSRGATVADVAILVIDAKDSIKPQTVESINHIREAKIPFVVAINKTDLPEANPNRVKNDLLKYEVITEEKGGTVPAVHISALTGDGIPDLLESLLLITSDLQLEYDTEAPAEAYIIETKKDRRGIVASIIIKNGTLKVGDTVYAGEQKAKIRTMFNDLGKPVRQIEPSQPVELLGLSEIPEVGTFITTSPVVQEKVEQAVKAVRTFEDWANMIVLSAEDEKRKLVIVLKCDSQGSLDAITGMLADNDAIVIQSASVGDINKSDVFMAKATKALVIGFSVIIDPIARELAKQEKVIIKTYDIIYELLEELEEVSLLLQEKENSEKNIKGEAKILATFNIEGETVFGAKVTKGKIANGDQIELYRNDNLIAKSKLVSLRIRAKSVQEVKKENECGMLFYPLLDIRVGDVIKSIS